MWLSGKRQSLSRKWGYFKRKIKSKTSKLKSQQTSVECCPLLVTGLIKG